MSSEGVVGDVNVHAFVIGVATDEYARLLPVGSALRSRRVANDSAGAHIAQLIVLALLLECGGVWRLRRFGRRWLRQGGEIGVHGEDGIDDAGAGIFDELLEAG